MMKTAGESPLPKRKTPRLKDYDYSSGGIYFVTFNVAVDDLRLSEITGSVDDVADHSKLTLTEYGAVVNAVIAEINESYPNACISHSVIMPNHVHLIMELREENKISLSRFVGLIKRMCTKAFGRNIWQKSFYEHVIADDDDYYYHCQYIAENPKKWIMGKDRYYM